MCRVPLKSRRILNFLHSHTRSQRLRKRRCCHHWPLTPPSTRLSADWLTPPSCVRRRAAVRPIVRTGTCRVSGRGGTSASFKEDDLRHTHTDSNRLTHTNTPHTHHITSLYLPHLISFFPSFCLLLSFPFLLSHDPTLLRPLFTSRSPSLSPCLLLSYGLAAELITKAN